MENVTELVALGTRGPVTVAEVTLLPIMNALRSRPPIVPTVPQPTTH